MGREPKEITDLDTLKSVTHPLRTRIRAVLRRGPANSTMLARELGVSTGLTSYHLREMARHGLVEEVPELARGRERWWRSVANDLRFPPRSRQSPRMREAMDEMNRRTLVEDLDLLARFQAARDELGEWGDAYLFSRGEIRVDRADLEKFLDDYVALLHRYRRPDDDPGDCRVLRTRFLAFPLMED
ncbi:helix-turn-helix domain-containing protein [Pseudonocardia acaciae]|uniref:helix-turn-helix domain-containing protein n=1 Tax=Pseudonocardia acaciae TaxID=551276 RepID=UPI000491F474|nr:helix-turn-helix domain-containing protein [Pseudonocardia acaciae]